MQYTTTYQLNYLLINMFPFTMKLQLSQPIYNNNSVKIRLCDIFCVNNWIKEMKMTISDVVDIKQK